MVYAFYFHNCGATDTAAVDGFSARSEPDHEYPLPPRATSFEDARQTLPACLFDLADYESRRSGQHGG